MAFEEMRREIHAIDIENCSCVYNGYKDFSEYWEAKTTF